MLFTKKPVKIHISELFLLDKLMYRAICLTVLRWPKYSLLFVDNQWIRFL